MAGSVKEPPVADVGVHRFRIGGQVLRMLQALGICAMALAGWFTWRFAVGGEGGVGPVVGVWLLAAFMLGLSLIVRGELLLDDAGIRVTYRLGEQRLRWPEIGEVRWGGHGMRITELASDNWQVVIRGHHGDRPVELRLSGPGVERQAEVRELLREHLPTT